MNIRYLALLVGLIATCAVPGQEQSTRATITLVQEDADIRAVVKTIADLSGANIVVAPEVSGTVTLHLRDVPWRAALDAAVRSAHARIVEGDHGILCVFARTKPADRFTLVGPKSFLTGYPARNPDGTVNVVVEIPTGTQAKWEVDKRSGSLRQEFVDGLPRVVDYLGYPGNYGMVPRTLLPEDRGGDGDPLDVIVLGPALGRGDVVPARILGVIELRDGGERDDKLLAVSGDSPLGQIESLAELEEAYPGALTIVETWFANYKGPGEVEIRGRGEAAQAMQILDLAAAAFERDHGK